jgi:hypothetical protein
MHNFTMITMYYNRINSLVTVLGTISGYYGIIATLYILLFGTGSLSPWGIVHNGCWKFRRFRKETEDELTKEANKLGLDVEGSTDNAGKVKELELWKLQIEKDFHAEKIKELENWKLQIEKNFADTSSINPNRTLQP